MKKKFRGYDPAMPEAADELWKNTKESNYHLYSMIPYVLFMAAMNYLCFTEFTISLEPRKIYSVGGLSGPNPDYFLTMVIIVTNIVLLSLVIRAVYFYIISKKEEEKAEKEINNN